MFAYATNRRNGEVTMYLARARGGPVVTGKNLAEAKQKMNQAMLLYRVYRDIAKK
jgi:hypothetical protein